MNNSHRSGRLTALRRIGVTVVILGVALAAFGCSNNGDDGVKTQEGPVCGVVDLDLIREIVGEVPLDVGVNVQKSADVPGETVVECDVRNEETSRSFLKISVVPEADPQAAGQELASQTKPEYGDGAFRRYDGDPGVGYGADYSTGPWKDGAQVSVVRGARTYEVFVFNWSDATPAERQSLAEEIVVNADENLDRAQPAVTDGTEQVMISADGTASALAAQQRIPSLQSSANSDTRPEWLGDRLG